MHNVSSPGAYIKNYIKACIIFHYLCMDTQKNQELKFCFLHLAINLFWNIAARNMYTITCTIRHYQARFILLWKIAGHKRPMPLCPSLHALKNQKCLTCKLNLNMWQNMKISTMDTKIRVDFSLRFLIVIWLDCCFREFEKSREHFDVGSSSWKMRK